MKRALMFLCFTILFFGCKNEPTKSNDLDKNKESKESVKDDLDLIEAEQAEYLETAYFYVLAPNGLSLRKTDDLKSEKILTIPFGEKVKQTEVIYSADDLVENIRGSMMPLVYKEHRGYAFSGFLSRFPPSRNEEDITSYVSRLKAIDSKVKFEDRETDPDFHEGIVETLFLPSIDWHEAFYLAKASYSIPKSFSFPGHEGVESETIEQIDKEDYVWSSFLSIKRKASRLDTIQYNWRAEGTGVVVLITKPKSNQLKIEYTGFAD